MSVTVPSEDQILSEAARNVREAATDPYFQGDPVTKGLADSLVTASSTMLAVEATMSLDLQLKNIRLPHDLASSVSYCAEVSDEAGAVLTALHAACAAARAAVLEAAGGEAKR